MLKRGPYKKSKEVYEKAVVLRQQGLGYKKIAQILSKSVKTIISWVRHIPAPHAHQIYCESLKKDLGVLKSKSSIKERIFSVRERKCEKCLITEWCEFPINLELDHINGDNRDNRLENLRLLCPNCHSYTPTWRRKKASL